MNDVYVFWTQFRRPEVQQWKARELREGRLRQGWGGPGTALLEAGLPVTAEVWLPRFTRWVRSWDVPEARMKADLEGAANRYRILRGLVDLKLGDLLIIPHLPSDEEITLARVSGGDRWELSTNQAACAHGRPDFGHLVEVDSRSLVTVPRESSLEARSLAEKFTNYRTAITRVANRRYADTAWRLFQGDNLHGT